MSFAKQVRLILLIYICFDVRSPDQACNQHTSQWHEFIAVRIEWGGGEVCYFTGHTIRKKTLIELKVGERKKKNKRKAKETQRSEKKVGKVVIKKVKQKIWEKPERRLWWAEKQSCRANGKSAGFMTMMACEPLGHGLLSKWRTVWGPLMNRLPTFSLSPLAFIILAASLRPVAFSSHLCTIPNRPLGKKGKKY